MTNFRHSRRDYRGDYRGDYSPSVSRACCSHPVHIVSTQHERGDYRRANLPLAVVRSVVGSSHCEQTLSGHLTTRLLSISKEKNREGKTLAKGIRARGVVSSHRPPTWQAGSDCGVEVTDHAITRYIERVDPRADYVTAIAALSSPAIIAAIKFGAPYVRLPGNQRIALDGATVVTVLPADQSVGCLDRRIMR